MRADRPLRAGFYVGIENVLGADIHNRNHLEPHLQHLESGDRAWLDPSARSPAGFPLLPLGVVGIVAGLGLSWWARRRR